jgi:predicted dehydrogenase
MTTIKVGIIGGGLMGREMASAFGRWCALLDMPARPELVAVADLNPAALDWFRDQVPSAKLLTTDHRELLADPSIEVVYVAVPHSLHELLYLDVLAAGKDLFAEKPFGIDLASAVRIARAARASGRFVRCSSEFPFFPGAQRVIELVKGGGCGRILEVKAAFLHSSDLDPGKKANWKRSSAACGEIGVLGDLGLHVAHIPLRLGWRPRSVYAQLQKGYAERPDGKGGMVGCDTWDNAALHCWIEPEGQPEPAPMRLEMKRLAPGATDSWSLEVLGTEGGARFSTSDPKALFVFERDGRGEQWWKRSDLGFATPFPTVTGGIFEVGFADVIQQMWAAYLCERCGVLGDRFGAATPDEAVGSQEIWQAALRSAEAGQVATLDRATE